MRSEVCIQTLTGSVLFFNVHHDLFSAAGITGFIDVLIFVVSSACECVQSLIADSFFSFCSRPPSVHQTSGQETWPAAGCRPCSFSPYRKLAEENFHTTALASIHAPHHGDFSLWGSGVLCEGRDSPAGSSSGAAAAAAGGDGGGEGGGGGGGGGISVVVKGLSVPHPLTPH